MKFSFCLIPVNLRIGIIECREALARVYQLNLRQIHCSFCGIGLPLVFYSLWILYLRLYIFKWYCHNQ